MSSFMGCCCAGVAAQDQPFWYLLLGLVDGAS